ncbi:MAG TPA: PQQ-dependent sugar dehydrogenase [Bryobacteraceae bacterium]|jgi:hypothetical protein
MLRELQQRIRDVRQGPDGFLYLLTAENDGALMRMEPWAAAAGPANRQEFLTSQVWAISPVAYLRRRRTPKQFYLR